MHFFRFFIITGLVLYFTVPLQARNDADNIVRRADQIRSPAGSYVFNATVIGFDHEEKRAENRYHVMVKDLEHTVLEFLFPASEKGKSLLMLQDDIWIFLPRVNKPVRVPLKNRLLGEVAIGDMTRTNFSHDYNATLLGIEGINNQEAYVLDLKAKSSKKPYGRIKYWVAKGTYRPIQAQFFTVSGKLLKTAVFGNFAQAAGGFRPLQVIYYDAVQKNKKSILTFQNMRRKDLPDRIFTKQHLQTLK